MNALPFVYVKILSRTLFLPPGLVLYFMLISACHVAWSKELPVSSCPPECHKHQPAALYTLWLWFFQAHELCSFAAQRPHYKACHKSCVGWRLGCSAEIPFLHIPMLCLCCWLRYGPIDPIFFSTSSFTCGRVPRLNMPPAVSSSHRQLTPLSVYRKYVHLTRILNSLPRMISNI